jgi:tyrosine-protein phosphatase YwqE
MEFKLYLGGEYLLHRNVNIDLIAETGIGTFGDGFRKYVLFEFPPWPIPPESEEILFKLQLMGIYPIVAHPERNRYVMDKLPEMAMRGILFQVNASSLRGTGGRRIRKSVVKLMERGMISFVASDAHNPWTRPMALSVARREVSETFGMGVADELFRDNPCKAVSGKPVEPAVDRYRRMEPSKGILDRLISLVKR